MVYIWDTIDCHQIVANSPTLRRYLITLLPNNLKLMIMLFSVGDVNECLSNPCNSQGTADCVQLINDYRCECKPGHTGQLCAENTTSCTVSPCLHGGTCNSDTNM